MLAVGMADGNVAVYNLQKNTGKPTYISTAKNGKHQDMVWQVNYLQFVYHGFGRAKICNAGLVLDSSQFWLLPQLPRKMMLASKVVKME